MRFWGHGRLLMGFYKGGKNKSAPFVFSQFKTEKTEMGYTFLTALDTWVDDESKKNVFVQS